MVFNSFGRSERRAIAQWLCGELGAIPEPALCLMLPRGSKVLARNITERKAL
jgi:hypothetical protein